MTRYYFDRLGDNQQPPMLDVPDGLDDYEIRDLIRKHARKHIESPGWAIIGPDVRRGTVGGYAVTNAETGYHYGTANKAPVFVEDTFAAAAEAALRTGA